MTNFSLIQEGSQKGVLQSEIVASGATITATGDQLLALSGPHQFAGVELFDDANGTPATVGSATGTVSFTISSPVSPQHDQTPSESSIDLSSYEEVSWNRPLSGIDVSISSPVGFTHWRLNLIAYK